MTEPCGEVLVIGRGRLGARLASALGARAVAGRRPARTMIRDAGVVVLAVPDPAIAEVAARIAPAIGASHVVLHCAGSRGAEVLAACAERGAATGVMHPLIAIAGPSSQLADRTFVIGGDARATAAASELVGRLGGHAVVAPLHGPAYHAAAALVANGSTALAALAVGVLVRLGMTRSDAEQAIAGLLASVAVNVGSAGVPRALTGPIVRGDAGTVSLHRAALAAVDRGVLRAYDAVAPGILEVAARAGLDAPSRRAIRRALRKEPRARPR